MEESVWWRAIGCTARVRFPAGQAFLHSFQTGYGAHPASYPTGTGGSGVKLTFR
jgi:hypothetical protein